MTMLCVSLIAQGVLGTPGLVFITILQVNNFPCL